VRGFHFLILLSHFICLAAKKLNKIQIYTGMYEYIIKNLLYTITSYEEHVAEKSLKATSTAE